MSTSSKARRAKVWAAALVAVALLCWPVEALTVRPARTAGLHFASRIAPDQGFWLRWTHSVTLRPVAERYEVGADRLLHLREMRFDQYGPNLPAGPEEGTVWRVEADQWVVTGYQIALERLNLGLSYQEHQLILGDRSVDLIALAGPGGLVRLQVERTPLIRIIWTEVHQWPNRSRLP